MSVHLSERQLQQIFVEICNVHLTGYMFKNCCSTILINFLKNMHAYIIAIDASALMLNSRTSLTVSAVIQDGG